MDSEWCLLLVKQSPDALIVADAKGVITFWNPGAEQLFGYTREEAEGARLEDLLMPGPAHGLPAVPGAISGEPLAEPLAGPGQETVRRHKNGQLVYVNASCRTVRDASGHGTAVLHRYIDITRLKIQRDAARIASRYGDLTDSMPDAIVIVNEHGRILLFNREAQGMFGFDREELLGQPIEVLLPERYHRLHVDHRDRHTDRSRSQDGRVLELFGVRKGGPEFPVEITLSPLESDVGPLMINAIRDITERKNIERALQDKNVELERASKAKDSFLATMSHELRTPLNAIIGFTGLMLMKLPGPLTADQERQLNAVQSSGKHLLSLINDLLDLAKIESGRVDIAREPVLWQSVVQEVETALRPAAELKGLVFEVIVPPHDVVVDTDRRALHQILLNLVNNAVKYTDTGRITVELRQNRHGPDWQTELSVIDTGIGIGPEDQARLFQAFTQVGTAGRSTEGTGLGLYLCRKLADLLGGRLDMESAVGVGSRFTFSVAASSPAPVESPPS